MNDREFELIQNICKRPGFFVGRDSFIEAVAYIAGYAHGVSDVTGRSS